MKLAFIGSGNVATRMSVAAEDAGHEVLEIWSRRKGSIDDVTKEADVYIICVTDEALPDVAKQIIRGREDKLFIHTAGSISVDVLDCEHRAVMWPMQTLSKDRAINFSEVPLFIEAGTDEDLQRVKKLAESLSSSVHEANGEDRHYLHLASVLCCNFVNHCYDMANEILRSRDIPFSVLLPLIDETARKVHGMMPRDAQTGPAKRHDEKVIKGHLEMLHSYPEIQNIYKLITKNIENYDKLRFEENQSNIL